MRPFVFPKFLPSMTREDVMQIFRVAHRGLKDEDGVPVGPYRGYWFADEDDPAFDQIYDLSSEIDDAHSDDEHPAPWNDGLGDVYSFEYCAFKSLEQLFQWFDDEWAEALHEAGFEVYVYQAPEDAIREGRHQILVDLERSELQDVVTFF